MKTSIGRVPSLIAALLLSLGAQVSVAQPGGGHGPRHGMAIEQMIASLKGQLNLNTSQQVMWDNAIAQTRSARDAGRGNMQDVHAALRAELAKTEPDLAALAGTADDAQARNQALRKQVRGEWLKLYSTFTPAQKAVVRDAALQRLARMEGFRARMEERMQMQPRLN